MLRQSLQPSLCQSTSRRATIAILLISFLTTAAWSAPRPASGKPAKKQKIRHLTEDQRALHALNRLTFGAKPGDVQRVLAIGIDKWIEQQLHPEAIDDRALAGRLAPLRTLGMSTHDMVESFPPQPLIRAVADGKRPMPAEPAKRLVYAVQIAKYQQEQSQKKQDAAKAASPQVTPAVAGNPPPSGPTPDQVDAARRIAANLANLPRDKRVAEMAGMPTEDILELQYLKPDDRDRLIAALSPDEREIFAATANPIGVVTGEVTQGKLLRAIYSERQLDEVLTDFWFNHFNVFINKDADRFLVTSYEREVIRRHALGKFKDLLVAVAEDPAMQYYLDNWLSAGPASPVAVQASRRKPQPDRPLPPPPGLNENYARELMELHTLGVNGGYTQKDVTEVARVFTGWTISQPDQGGQFMFDQRKHEPGDKTVLGTVIHEAGQQEGLQVLAMLAAHPSTARFVCTKLARRFVSDDPPPALIDHMAQTWTSTDGDIREVLRTLFKSREFWSGDAYRAKVKTPLEFVVSIVRATGADVTNATPLMQTLNRMGMPPYGKDAPTGYKTDADTWLSSDALLDRMNFALAYVNGKVNGVKFDSAHLLATRILEGGAAPQLSKAKNKNSHNANTGEDAALAMIEDALLAHDISQQSEQAIRSQLQDPKITGDALSDPMRSLNVMTALVLGSPEFQRR
jgi:uncharacterized protein (DUF1800 family)